MSDLCVIYLLLKKTINSVKMLSDSDSDSDDLAKYMAKTQRLWQNYRVPEFPNDNFHDTEESSASGTNGISIPSVSQPCANVVISTQPNTGEEKHENVKSVDTNSCGRLINKLDSLSEQVKTLISDIDNKRKNPGKSRGPAKKRCLRSSNRTVLSTNIVVNPSDTMSNDQELPTTIIDEELPICTIQEDEELNPVVSVNVLWKSLTRHTFKVHKYQALTCITEHYCENYNLNPKLLFFTLDGNYIRLDESSYVSLRLNRFKVLDGGSLPESYMNHCDKLIPYQGKDLLHFQVQFNDRRSNKISVSCQKDDKMEMIFWEVSKNIGEPFENIRLSFDGSVMKPSSSICDMDLEEGDCFDAEITKSK